MTKALASERVAPMLPGGSNPGICVASVRLQIHVLVLCLFFHHEEQEEK